MALDENCSVQPTNPLTNIAMASALRFAWLKRERTLVSSCGLNKHYISHNNKLIIVILYFYSFNQPTASRGWDEHLHWMSFSHLLIRMRMALQGCRVHCRTWETQSVIYPIPVVVPICPLANVPVRAATATRLRVTSTRATRRMYPVTVQLSSAQR